ncbi:MAG: hypothetical protein OXM54_15375 [Acidimicrobiaceae bacterium]|nr:hypothetical protein [Acidimicrobiaceae bacterium]
MRLLKPAARLAAVAVLAAGLVAVASPAAQAQSECAEYEQQVRSLTQQIRQSPTDEALRDQRRRIAQAALAACVDDDAVAAAIDWCRAVQIGTVLSVSTTANCADSQSPRVAGAVSTGGDQDRFNAAYDRALEQATAAARASTDAVGGGYSAGFRVTGQSENLDGTTSSDCYVVIRTISYSPHNPGESPRWTATEMPDGLWQRVFTDVGLC